MWRYIFVDVHMICHFYLQLLTHLLYLYLTISYKIQSTNTNKGANISTYQITDTQHHLIIVGCIYSTFLGEDMISIYCNSNKLVNRMMGANYVLRSAALMSRRNNNISKLINHHYNNNNMQSSIRSFSYKFDSPKSSKVSLGVGLASQRAF